MMIKMCLPKKNVTIETNEGLFEQEAYFNTDPSVFR